MFITESDVEISFSEKDTIRLDNPPRRKLGPEMARAVNVEVKRLFKMDQLTKLSILTGSQIRWSSKIKMTSGEFVSISQI